MGAKETAATFVEQVERERNPLQTKRVIASSLAGTTLEFYEFFVYGTVAALAFNYVFFPEGNDFAATLSTFAIFAVGFVARPIGSIVFGHLGDKLGRKKTLILSLVLMGASTVLIGCLPSFSTVGIVAPILLVVLRLVQGLALGGEWGGAALMLVENAAKGKKAAIGSVVMMGVPGGLVLAAVVAAASVAISGDQFEVWGWRIPFVLSAALLAVAFWIRLGVKESPEFAAARERLEARPKAPFSEVFRNNWGDLVAALGVAAPGNAIFFIVSTYSLSYLTSNLGLPRETGLYAQIAAATIYFATIPFFGRLADRVGEWKVVAGGAIGAALFGLAYFPLLQTGNVFVIFGAMTLALAGIHAALQAPQASLFASRFDVRVRYTGVALSQAIPTMVIGGTAPFVATLLVGTTGNTLLVSAYVIVLAAWGFGAALVFRKKDADRVEA
ncbi:MAG TPA: MHS family MFS transporter [Candidatus Agrococcus pullicola]|uniref:MHS family MFS transporter n=1 Tax=Candidatus Agrococcus pullicola TaxID=2838429 RepID=A0A9D1YSG6_9MICO|nr:MHS family MFS transporter [Candidatus Agrococcus pullicola]